jgi:hypothetical protein
MSGSLRDWFSRHSRLAHFLFYGGILGFFLAALLAAFSGIVMVLSLVVNLLSIPVVLIVSFFIIVPIIAVALWKLTHLHHYTFEILPRKLHELYITTPTLWKIPDDSRNLSRRIIHLTYGTIKSPFVAAGWILKHIIHAKPSNTKAHTNETNSQPFQTQQNHPHYCNHCGNSLFPGDKFCVKCGRGVRD